MLSIRISVAGTSENLPFGTAFLHSLCKALLFCVWPIALIVFLASHYKMPYDRPLKLQTVAIEKKLSGGMKALMILATIAAFFALSFCAAQFTLKQVAVQAFYTVQNDQISSFSSVCKQSSLHSFKTSVSGHKTHLEYQYWISGDAAAATQEYVNYLTTSEGFQVADSGTNKLGGLTIVLTKNSSDGDPIVVSLLATAKHLNLVVDCEVQGTAQSQAAA